jgi:hypothetical protein
MTMIQEQDSPIAYARDNTPGTRLAFTPNANLCNLRKVGFAKIWYVLCKSGLELVSRKR